MPDLPMPAEDVARLVMSIGGGLAVDDLVEPDRCGPTSSARPSRSYTPGSWLVDAHDGSATAVAIVTV
jgi:hypothetical protein